MMPLRSLLAYARDVQHGALLSMCTLHSTVACCHSGLSIISACLICGYTFADDDLPFCFVVARRREGRAMKFWVEVSVLGFGFGVWSGDHAELLSRSPEHESCTSAATGPHACFEHPE